MRLPAIAVCPIKAQGTIIARQQKKMLICMNKKDKEKQEEIEKDAAELPCAELLSYDDVKKILDTP